MNLRGIIPIILTPFRVDESIDEEALRAEVDYAIQAGAGALCAPAFASEHYKLSDPERYSVARTVVQYTAGRVPVLVSTGHGSVHATVEFSRYAEALGADGLMVVAPRTVPLGVMEFTRYYEKVCRSVTISVVLQDADFTGSGLATDLFIDLQGRCPNFKYAKLENVLAGTKCEEIIRRSGGKLEVLYGVGGIALFDGLEHGACGIMPGTGMVDLYAHIFKLYDSGRVTQAKTLFYKMQPCLFFAQQHLELAIQLQKRVLVRRGVFPTDLVREPTLQLDAKYRCQLEEMVELVIGLSKEVHMDGGPDSKNTPGN